MTLAQRFADSLAPEPPTRREYLRRAKVALLRADEMNLDSLRRRFIERAIVALRSASECELADGLRRGGEHLKMASSVESTVDDLLKAEIGR